jgi:hypothetical protein
MQIRERSHITANRRKQVLKNLMEKTDRLLPKEKRFSEKWTQELQIQLKLANSMYKAKGGKGKRIKMPKPPRKRRKRKLKVPKKVPASYWDINEAGSL